MTTILFHSFHFLFPIFHAILSWLSRNSATLQHPIFSHFVQVPKLESCNVLINLSVTPVVALSPKCQSSHFLGHFLLQITSSSASHHEPNDEQNQAHEDKRSIPPMRLNMPSQLSNTSVKTRLVVIMMVFGIWIWIQKLQSRYYALLFSSKIVCIWRYRVVKARAP